MITLKLPVVVDANLLRVAFETAHKCGTEVRVETFFRIVHDDRSTLDCETVAEVVAYAEVFGLKERSVTPPSAGAVDPAAGASTE